MLIRHHLRKNLARQPFNLKRTPKLTEKQRAQHLKFARENPHWSKEAWLKVTCLVFFAERSDEDSWQIDSCCH